MSNFKTVGNTVKSCSKFYIFCLILFASLSLLSFVLLVMGIFSESRKLVFVSGLWFAGWGSVLGFTALPFGFATEMITGGAKGSMHRFVRWVLSTFLLTGACVSLFSWIIPSGKINPETLIPLILMIIILGVLGLLPFFRALTGFVTFSIFIVHLLTIFLPVDLGGVVREKINDVCFFVVAPKRVSITREQIKKGEIEFFRKDGKPKIWCYMKEDGTFDLFNGDGYHPTYEVKLKPVTRGIISLIEKQLDNEENARQAKIKQERIRQEQGRLEQQKEQLDREESSRKDLMKPDVYMIEKKLGRFGSGLKAYLHRVDILDDRTIRVTLLIENDTRSDVWVKLREPEGCFVVFDNLGNRYSPKVPIEEYYTCRLPNNRIWLQIDFEPLKRNVGYLRFQGIITATWDGSYEHGKIKFEYTLKSTGH